MARFEILHNPRCSKSRQALQRLYDAGVEPVVVDYLAAPPSRANLERILRLLGIDDPRAIMRTGEAIYRELDLAHVTDRARLLAALTAHPILIERPIVIRDDTRAVVARPPERVDELLGFRDALR
ncbi:MAG: arsenate reductase (glutaredoxin) [Deltaproteobacteria bacterium]|nr:arsenate reductase (glutaredoxin) [Deltaproteobacteria bacterium]